MDDFHEAAERQAREMNNARRQARENAVHERMGKFSITRALAEYLLELETRIEELERRSH